MISHIGEKLFYGQEPVYMRGSVFRLAFIFESEITRTLSMYLGVIQISMLKVDESQSL